MKWIDWLLCKLNRCRRCYPIHDERGIGGACLSCGRIYGWMWRGEIDVALGFAKAYIVPGPVPTHIVQLPRAIVHHNERLTRHSTPLQ